MMWYFGIVVAMSLYAAQSEVNNLSDAVCCAECSCNIRKSTECFMKFLQQCIDGICIDLNFRNKTSIIQIALSIIQSHNITDVTENADEMELFKLEISEFDTAEKEYIVLETRNLNVSKINEQNARYLTRTSKARLCISPKEEWPNYDIKLSFKEINYHRYKPEIPDTLNMTGEIWGEYVPNSVSLFKLPEDPRIKWKGIEITIQDLEINAEQGEYLLIGAGSPEDLPPKFIAQITNSSSFYVANASAYVEIIFASTLKTDEYFKILWNRKGGEIPPTLNPVDMLNSVLICFYNYSEAEREFEQKGTYEAFPEFREAFAKSAGVYLNSECLDKSSIKLIGHHTQVQSSNALSILMAIECEGNFFKYQDIKKAMRNFEMQDENKTLGYKVGLCEDIFHEDLPYKERWSTLIYALVPVFGFFILIVWAWRNKIFSQKFSQKKKESITIDLDSNSIVVEPNTYEQTIPKVRLDDGQGRRQTLIQGSSQDLEERTTDYLAAVEMNAISSTSQESDSLIHVLTNRKNKRRPSIQSMLSRNEEETDIEKYSGRKIKAEENEHLYDSVSNNNEIGETRL